MSSTRAVSALQERSVNPRVHDAVQIEALKKAIQEYGFQIPILIDEHDVILAGHARVQAARELDMDRVPVAVATGWTEAQKRAYVVADNRLGEMSVWDLAELEDMLATLPADIDLSDYGFGAPDEMPGEEPDEWAPTEHDMPVDEEPAPLSAGGTASRDEAGEQRVTCPECGYRWHDED